MGPPATTAEVISEPTAGPEGRLSVAFVSPGWPASAFANGVVTCVAAIADGLRLGGHTVHILAQKLAGPEGDEVHELYAPRAKPLADRILDNLSFRLSPGTAMGRFVGRAVAGAARRLADGPGLDLVEMEESAGWPSDVTLRCPVPVVVRLHGPWFLNGPAMGVVEDADFHRRVRAEGRAIAEADAVSSPSASVLERTRAYYGLALADAEVIPNSLPTPAADRRWRPEAAEPGSILFVGRFDRHKGGDLAIDAFERVLRELPDARFRFVGPDKGCVDGEGRTWAIGDYVRERAPAAAASRRFEWLGQMPPAEIERLRRVAAVTLVASRYETFSMTTLEALALGCPLVATRAGGIPEIVDDGVNGLLCPAGDADELARALIRLLTDRDLAAQLGRRGAVDADRRFSPAVVAGQTVAFYRRVLQRWDRRPPRGWRRRPSRRR